MVHQCDKCGSKAEWFLEPYNEYLCDFCAEEGGWLDDNSCSYWQDCGFDDCPIVGLCYTCKGMGAVRCGLGNMTWMECEDCEGRGY